MPRAETHFYPTGPRLLASEKRLVTRAHSGLFNLFPPHRIKNVLQTLCIQSALLWSGFAWPCTCRQNLCIILQLDALPRLQGGFTEHSPLITTTPFDASSFHPSILLKLIMLR